MTDFSNLLLIAELAGTQETRSVTVNEAIAKLEAGAGLFTAEDVLLDTPPAGVEGNIYILGTGPTGVWSGHPHEIALYYNGSWRFMPPRPGLMAYAENEDKYYRYRTGYGWELLLSVADIVATEQIDFFSSFIETASDKDYYFVINSPIPITILSVTTRAFGGGTGTLTGEINGTPLGGSANAISASEETQNHSSANVVSIGADFRVAISVDSPPPTDLAITIKYSYELAS